MPRVKRGVIATKRRRNVLRQTKGFRWGRKSKERAAKEALLHAGINTFTGRKEKKRDFRTLWNLKINAAARILGTTYSVLIFDLKRRNVGLNRKMLAELAEHHPEIFKKVAAK